MRAFLGRSLTRVGHEVRSVCDGFEALPFLVDGDFDLLITDIVMPGMDGLELARRSSLEMPSMRVIFITGFAAVFITGFAAVSLNSHTSQNSDARVLSKPFHLRTLVDEIGRVLAAA